MYLGLVLKAQFTKFFYCKQTTWNLPFITHVINNVKNGSSLGKQTYLKTHWEGEEWGEGERAYILEKPVMCDIVILQIELISFWKKSVLSKLLKSSKYMYRLHPVLFAQTKCNYRVIGTLAAIFIAHSCWNRNHQAVFAKHIFYNLFVQL